MNTETPPTHAELVEKLNEAETIALREGEFALVDLLRATIAELKRGREDTRRLDWADLIGRKFYCEVDWGAGASRKTVREAIDAYIAPLAAISSTAKEEA